MQKFEYIFIRHRKENIKKCSLQGLFGRKDCCFLQYPEMVNQPLGDLFDDAIVLDIDGPLLQPDDCGSIVIIDGTWVYAKKMFNAIPSIRACKRRRIPGTWKTGYPRYQTGCSDPDRGLASIEALYIAARIMGKNAETLLNHYYWKDLFLEKNKESLL